MSEIKEYRRRLTYKGGVIIPVEIRRLLGVKPRGEIRFRISDGDKIELLPPAMTLEATFGSVKPKNRPLDFKRMRDSAIDDHVQKTTSKTRR
jgi:bifunctional DNA-binding transcriptional regulator/antitoxin component of YhaV-PrlF toxin-antitoxin module